MNPFKYFWGMLFRLFPCPTHVGLNRVGNPGRDSPVLVTCNFYITVRRLMRSLKGLDAWILVADSKGVNVWCSAEGDELNTRSVILAIKVSGIGDLVDHRNLILPPLGAPGIVAREIREQTGWMVLWGPVRLKDIPHFLEARFNRTEEMKRVTYSWVERLDTGLSSLFPVFSIGAVGFFAFGRHLFLDYLVVGAGTLLLFVLVCPYLPGKRGLTKVLFLDALLGISLVIYMTSGVQTTLHIRANLIIVMVLLLFYGSELGGMASNMPSDLDPFLARLGIGRMGLFAFGGSTRTELLNEYRVLRLNPDLCIGCRNCTEVCPQGVWSMNDHGRAVQAHPDKCTACRACIVQCEGGAIEAKLTDAIHPSSGGKL